MILLDSSYVSPLLIETLKEQNITICNIVEERILGKESEVNLTEVLTKEKHIIMNSENAFCILNKDYSDAPITKLANLFKNKAMFRQQLMAHYPNLFFKEVSLEQLLEMDASSLPYPVVLKPSVGYSSVGVYRIENEQHFHEVIIQLHKNMSYTSKTYSSDVLQTESYIIEGYITGKEFAVDVYFDENNAPVVLNVFTRMFKNEADMSDRIYYTSKQILTKYLEPITNYLGNLSKIFDMKNLPMHMEFRLTDDDQFIPIEVNPLRFAGAGTTELGFYAYGINPYDYFFAQKRPMWNEIIEAMDDKIYSFTCAEFASDTKLDNNLTIHHDLLKQQFKQILSYRHIPYENGLTFAVIFFCTDSLDENEHILTLDFMEFVDEQQLFYN